MKRLAIAALALAACWRSSEAPPPAQPISVPSQPARAAAPPPSDADLAMEQMERFADDLCACHDMACIQGVSDDMTRWSKEQSAKQADPPKLSDEQLQHMTDVANRMGTCMQNAMSGSGAGSAAPTP